MAKDKKDNEQEEIDKEMAIKLENDKKEEDKHKEVEYQNRITEQEKRTNEANEKISRLEGSLEAFKSFQQNPGDKTAGWTKEQWDEFEEKTGLKKETLSTIDNVFGEKLRAVESKFSERARIAEERAKLAEDKYSVYEGKRSFENQTRDYLAKKPQYKHYEKEIREFVNDYPEEMRKDPVKLASLFDKAETYIKGKVGEKEMRRTSGGSERFGSDDESNSSEEFKADLTDLRPSERLLMERLVPTAEKMKTLKANRHDMSGDNGVMINTREEFDRYKKK